MRTCPSYLPSRPFSAQLHFLHEDCTEFRVKLVELTSLRARAKTDRNTLRDDVLSSSRDALTRDFDLALLDDDALHEAQYAQLALATANEDDFVALPSEFGWSDTGDQRYDELEQAVDGMKRRRREAKSNVARNPDDLKLPDQTVDNLTDDLIEDDDPNGVHAATCLAVGDSQRLDDQFSEDDFDEAPLPLDNDDEAAATEMGNFLPMDMDEDTDDEFAHPLITRTESGGGRSTSNALVNVTHSSIAPSPAMQEQAAAERDRAARAVKPGRLRAPRPGSARCRMLTFDEETHLGGGAYRIWLNDASDTVIPDDGRPRIFDSMTGLNPETLRRRFFSAMFRGFLGERARHSAPARLEAHFRELLRAKQEPKPIKRTSQVESKRVLQKDDDHPEVEAAARAEALAREAAEMEAETRRERRGRIKQRLRGQAVGDISSDDEAGYGPKAIVYRGNYGSSEDAILMPSVDEEYNDDGVPMPPTDEDDDLRPSPLALASHDDFCIPPSSRGVLSLANLLEGHNMDERDALNYSLSASLEMSSRDGKSRGSLSFDIQDPPSNIACASISQPLSLTQVQLAESEAPCESDAVRTGKAMLAAARSVSPGAVGQSAYNLLQFLSAKVFVGHLTVSEAGERLPGQIAKSLSELCLEEGLSRVMAAKCFYQCLVLIGGGFLDAAQDLSVPYGEVLIRPGSRFTDT